MAHSYSSLVLPYATTCFMVRAIKPSWKPFKIYFILFWNYFFFRLHCAACRTSLTRDWTHVPCGRSRVLTTRPPGRSMGLLTSVNGANTHRFFEARNLGHSSCLPNHHHHHLIHPKTMSAFLTPPLPGQSLPSPLEFRAGPLPSSPNWCLWLQCSPSSSQLFLLCIHRDLQKVKI